jgi:hypothetical protein
MEKRIYIAPEVEIVEVKVEQGFATTGVPGSSYTEDVDDDGFVNPW